MESPEWFSINKVQHTSLVLLAYCAEFVMIPNQPQELEEVQCWHVPRKERKLEYMNTTT